MKRSFLKNVIVGICLTFSALGVFSVVDVQVVQAQTEASVSATDAARIAGEVFLSYGKSEFGFDPIGWAQGLLDFVLKQWLQVITGLLAVAGYAFDKVIVFALDSSVFGPGGTLGATVDILWRFIRDIGNIVIVFSLLYLAIRTIIDGEGFADKSKLANVLLAAVLINFSLFATKAAFNISNYIALQIRNQITYVDGSAPAIATGATSATLSPVPKSLSAGIVRALGVPNSIENISQQTSTNKSDHQGIQLQYMLMLTLSTIGICFILLAGLLMLLYRFIVFIFLIILSPLGLVCFFIPWLKKYGQEWVDKLKALTFLAPVYFLSFYLSMLLLSKIVQLGTRNPGEGFTAILVQLFTQAMLIVGTLLATVLLPVKMSAAGGEFVGSVGKWAEGRARSISRAPKAAALWGARRGGQLAAGGAARTGQFGGKLAGRIVGGSEETRKRLQMEAREGSFLQRQKAKARLGLAEGPKSRTYDLRNVGGMGKKLGIGDGIKNYGDRVEERKKKLEKKQKEEMKKYGYDDTAKDPEVKRAILEATAKRDNHQVDLKEAEKEYNAAVKVNTLGMTDTARQAHEADLRTKQETLKIAQEVMEDYEKKVGEKKNIGMQKHYERMKKDWANNMTLVRREALEKMKKEMEKKFKEDGKAKQTAKKKSNSSTPLPIPPTPPTP